MLKPLLFLLLTASLAAAKPNVLLLLSDDQAWGDYGFMGHEQIQTPALDKLSEQSITYLRGYTPVPLCRPALACLSTGLYPHQHGVTGNDVTLPGGKKGNGRANPQTTKFYTDVIDTWKSHPDWNSAFAEAGYRTLQTGKWWEGNPVEDGGFTEGMTHGDPKRGGRHGDEGLKIGREGLEPIKDFVRKSGDTPWFVWYGVFLPHSPHTPPADLLKKYKKVAPTEAVARYWACCEWLDRTIADLVAFLDAEGQLENTIILYTTDNGWIQDPKTPNRYAPRSKQTIYEGGIRTPIMVSWKGHLEPRLDKEHLASNLDLWPTVAKLTGIPLPKGLPGIDLTDPAAVAKRQAIFGADFQHDIAKLGEPAKSLDARYVIHGDWKLIIPADGKPAELYDLSDDPWEKNDLAKANPGKVKQLHAELDGWWKP
jgi:uncharacterized sulfatase